MARKTEDKTPRGVFEKLTPCRPCEGKPCADCGGSSEGKKPCASCCKKCRGTGRTGWGVWWVRYSDAEGHEHREKVGSKGAAVEVYRKRKTQVREAKFFPEDVVRIRPWTVNDAVKAYLDARPHNKGWKTDDWHGRMMKEAFGETPLDELNPHDVEMWLVKREADTSPSTANRSLGFLKRICRKAIRDEKAKRDVTVKVDPRDEPPGRDRYLKPDESEALWRELDDEERAVVEVAIHTGFRRGNVFTLRWDYVDFDTHLISLPMTKSGKRHYLPMNSHLEEVLRAQRERSGHTPWVFPNEIGGPDDARNWWKRKLKPALERAKINNFRFHDLRHTFGSWLTMEGAGLRTVQTLMGHSSSRVTERYSHLSPGYLVDAVERLAAIGTRESAPSEQSAPESAPPQKQRRRPPK